MTREASVAVIGAGVLGTSTAVHLRDAGVEDVVVIDRDGEGQGTSAAGAGFIGEWAGAWDPHLGAEELAIERYGLGFYRSLQESGHDVRFRPNGNLFLAASEATFEANCGQAMATEGARRLSASEVAEVTGGVVAAEAIGGGVLHPNGGQVSAGLVAPVLAAIARERGVRLSTRNPVQRIVVEDGCVRGVETERDSIAAGAVVVAAGAWANVLLRDLGVFLPMAPLVAARVVTEPLDIPPTMPTIMMRETSMYAREEYGGLLWGTTFAAAPRRAFVAQDPPERFEQLPLDGYEEMKQTLTRSYPVMPRLAQARSATIAYGAPTYTPDGRGMIGAVPGIEGLYVVSGCNEGGVTHGPGYGRVIAELVAYGEPRLCSLGPFQVDRFGDVYRTTEAVATALAR